MGKEADEREWEQWLLVAGACLANGVTREKVFKEIDPRDCPYPQLRNILVALKDGKPENIQREAKAFYFLNGVDTSGGILNGIVGRVRTTAEQRRRIRVAELALEQARHGT